MPSEHVRLTVNGTVQDLLFSYDPETRCRAAEDLSTQSMGVAHERYALDALTTALRDPSSTVQEAAFQSLIRFSSK